MPFKELSIKEAGGVLAFLDLTKDKHNGYSGSDWVKMEQAGVNVTNRARAFGVTPQTGRAWQKQLGSADKKAQHNIAVDELGRE